MFYNKFNKLLYVVNCLQARGKNPSVDGTSRQRKQIKFNDEIMKIFLFFFSNYHIIADWLTYNRYSFVHIYVIVYAYV